MCAQEIFSMFFMELLRIIDEIGGEANIVQGRRRIFLGNDNISEVVRAFKEAGLGSAEDALACIITILESQKKLPESSSDILERKIEEGEDYRRERLWEKASGVLRSAFLLSQQTWQSRIKDPDLTPSERRSAADDLRQSTHGLCECYRWALITDGGPRKLRLFALEGVLWVLDRWRDMNDHGDSDVVRVNDWGVIARNITKDCREDQKINRLHQKIGSIVGYLDLIEREDRGIICALHAEDFLLTLYHLKGNAAKEVDREGRTALLLAAKNGWWIVVKGLIELGADVDSQTTVLERCTALHYAAASGDFQIFKYILDDGVSADLEDNDGRTPLSYAVENQDIRPLQLLLENGESLGSGHEYGRTPLRYAVKAANKSAVELLLKKVSPDELHINTKDNEGRTALYLASMRGFVSIVKMLLGHEQVKIDPEDDWLHYPTVYATVDQHEMILELLEKVRIRRAWLALRHYTRTCLCRNGQLEPL